MTTATETRWTKQDSEDLDRWAASFDTPPLKPDPVLWKTFEQDRREAPWSPGQPMGAGFFRPMTCRHCGTALRPRTTTLEDHPGTVLHSGRGLCGTCYKQHPESGRLVKPQRPEQCTLCNVPMRSRKTSAEQYPGTSVHRGRGMCTDCYNASNRKGDPKPKTVSMPERCRRCRQNLRPAHTTREQHPGTVLHAGHGLCCTCRTRKDGVPHRPRGEPAPPHCVCCGHRLRPAHTRAANWPGTRKHQGHGLCAVCHNQQQRSKHGHRHAAAHQRATNDGV